MATDEGLVPGGIYQDAHGDVYMRDPCGSNLWLHPGDGRAYADKEVARPLTRYVPAKGKGTTIYRITRKGGDVKVGPAQRLAGILGVARQSMYRSITRIERAVIDDSQFEDITSEYAFDRGVDYRG